ncbi:hypothetical protein THOG05_140097 [Vibrio rotiferianus]|nr:hypothetical protein THOG05_140097 [Vibrio rotiferianus]CAH1569811.1 hypothetical protein THOG10_20046 [Vibrio rotiferianus]CAH1571902.1 hypothetical protein THOB06_20046 [Vibrio rotiferianus]CAH1581521.1 hypothetical protein THOE12_60230 [Vibrio rotiferianus]
MYTFFYTTFSTPISMHTQHNYFGEEAWLQLIQQHHVIRGGLN